jgi:hypothetical protein
MRFLENGSDIPDDLIRAQLEGSVVFLCGAGVSVYADLPLFGKLTRNIYETLGETPENDSAEERAMCKEEYDRALRSLEKRTRRPGSPNSLVRETTARLLSHPIDIPLLNHLSLLHLSKDSEGRTKILTTNFDTLFEHAAKDERLDIPSHTGKALPKPGSPRDYGILHIHGLIGDEQLGLKETDLVLTSADFGDAYLRDGWASRYIEDRLRQNILVLVGYSAEDAAMRLLLETLDADRERFPDLEVAPIV